MLLSQTFPATPALLSSSASTVSPQPGSAACPFFSCPPPWSVGTPALAWPGRAHLRQVGEAAGKIPGAGEVLQPPALPTQEELSPVPQHLQFQPALSILPQQTNPSQVLLPSMQPAPSPAWATLGESQGLGTIPELFFLMGSSG